MYGNDEAVKESMRCCNILLAEIARKEGKNVISIIMVVLTLEYASFFLLLFELCMCG